MIQTKGRSARPRLAPLTEKITETATRKHRDRRQSSDDRYPRSFRAWEALVRERPYSGGWSA